MNSKIVLLITLLFSSAITINAMLWKPKDPKVCQEVEKREKEAQDKIAAKEEEHQKAVKIVLYNMYRQQNVSTQTK